MLAETAIDKDRAKTEVQVGIQYLVFLVNTKRNGVTREQGVETWNLFFAFYNKQDGMSLGYSERRSNVM